MNLRDYREMPDNGMFEKIERRLRVRRTMRIAVAAVAVVAVVGAVVLFATRQDTVRMQPTETVVAEARMPEVKTMEPAVSQPINSEDIVKGTAVDEHPDTQPQPTVREEETVYDCVFASSVEEEPQSTVPEVQVATLLPEAEPVAIVVKEVQEVEKPVAEKGGAPTQQTQHYDNLLWAPNAIAPVADDERNRVFKVTATSEVSHFHLIIFNRGGRQVFATDDINEAWDATMGGSPLSQGTYVWVAKFRDSDGVLRQEKGTVTVIR